MHSRLTAIAVCALSFGLACSNGGGQSRARSSAPQGQTAGQTESQATCDSIRIRTRRNVLQSLGMEQMKATLQKISPNISADDVRDLASLAKANSASVSETEKKQVQEMIASIYAGAIARAGLKEGETETVAEIKRTLTIGPAAAYWDAEGWVTVMISNRAPTGIGEDVPNETDAGIAYLAANSDQSRYKIFVATVSRPNQLLSLTEFVNEELPTSCAKTSSALDRNSFDSLPSGV